MERVCFGLGSYVNKGFPQLLPKTDVSTLVSFTENGIDNQFNVKIISRDVCRSRVGFKETIPLHDLIPMIRQQGKSMSGPSSSEGL